MSRLQLLLLLRRRLRWLHRRRPRLWPRPRARPWARHPLPPPNQEEEKEECGWWGPALAFLSEMTTFYAPEQLNDAKKIEHAYRMYVFMNAQKELEAKQGSVAAAASSNAEIPWSSLTPTLQTLWRANVIPYQYRTKYGALTPQDKHTALSLYLAWEDQTK